MKTEIVAIRSKVTGQWSYCPAPAVSILRLHLDDKPTGFMTADEALAAARADRSVPKGATFTVQAAQ